MEPERHICDLSHAQRTHRGPTGDLHPPTGERSTMAIAALEGWSSEQKHVVAASYLGWTLDAFGFFLLVLC
jgi:hypothetical protein